MKRIIVFVACLLPGMYAVWLGGYIIGRDMERARHVAPSSAAPQDACGGSQPAILSSPSVAPNGMVYTANGCPPVDQNAPSIEDKPIEPLGADETAHAWPAPPPKKKAVKPRAKVTPLGIGGPTTGMDTYIVPVDGHSPKKKAVNPHMMHGKGVFIAPKIIIYGSGESHLNYSFTLPSTPMPADHPRLVCDYTGSQEYRCNWEEKKAVNPSPWDSFYLPVIPDGYYLICSDYQHCRLEKNP